MNPLFFIIPFFALIVIILIYKKINKKDNNYVISDPSLPLNIPPLGISLGYNILSADDSKLSPKKIYYSEQPELMNSVKLWANSSCTIPAANGYYSNGVNWRTWVSPSFVNSGHH